MVPMIWEPRGCQAFWPHANTRTNPLNVRGGGEGGEGGEGGGGAGGGEGGGEGGGGEGGGDVGGCAGGDGGACGGDDGGLGGVDGGLGGCGGKLDWKRKSVFVVLRFNDDPIVTFLVHRLYRCG